MKYRHLFTGLILLFSSMANASDDQQDDAINKAENSIAPANDSNGILTAPAKVNDNTFNDALKNTGQNTLSINEETNLILNLTDLTLVGPDYTFFTDSAQTINTEAIYKEGKAAYDNNDCTTATRLLREYIKNTLYISITKKEATQAAINWCLKKHIPRITETNSTTQDGSNGTTETSGDKVRRIESSIVYNDSGSPNPIDRSAYQSVSNPGSRAIGSGTSTVNSNLLYKGVQRLWGKLF